MSLSHPIFPIMTTALQSLIATKQTELARFQAAMHRAHLNSPAYLEYAKLCEEIQGELDALMRSI